MAYLNVKPASAYTRKPRAASQLTGSSAAGFGFAPQPVMQPTGTAQVQGFGGAGAVPYTGQAYGQAANPAPASSQVGPTGLPIDPAYDATIAALGSKRDQLLAGYGADRTSNLLDYGYTEGADHSLSFDPNNPFSRAALLKRRYDQSRKGANTSMAARGQLYSGALQRQRDDLNFQQGAGENSLMNALARFLAQNTSSSAGARTDYDLAAAQAMGDRLSRTPR